MSDQHTLNQLLLDIDLPESTSQHTETLKQSLDLPQSEKPSSEPIQSPTHPRDLLSFDEPTLPPFDETRTTQRPYSTAKDLTEQPSQISALNAALSSSLTSINSNTSNTAPPASSIIPTLVQLTEDLCFELRQNLAALLQLNPGRRKSLLCHLELLTGSDSTNQKSKESDFTFEATRDSTNHRDASKDQKDAKEELRKWIVGPRSANQERALKTYLDEVAIVCLSQALLLKAWSDRGIRAFEEKELCQLNWALSQALKPNVPLNREGWQITRSNLYSWFNPTEALRKKIWRTLIQFDLRFEGSHLIESLLRFRKTSERSKTSAAHSALAAQHVRHSYDSRFLSTLFANLSQFGLSVSLSPLGTHPGLRTSQDPYTQSRNPTLETTPARLAFSPTLRDGTMIRTSPKCFQWIGMESYPFDMLISELTQLWNGPAVPPLWAEGNGLEAHSLDQLPLKWNNPRPSALLCMRDIESCELSVVLEETSVKLNSRSLEGKMLAAQVDSLPYYHEIRTGDTTLGSLQACLSITKLRPGGLLFWARNEPLTSKNGHKLIKFLLDKSTLVSEWDFSQVEHSLPHTSVLFPKYLYLFKREPQLEVRNLHKPKRIQSSGHIRSHVEVVDFLREALSGNTNVTRSNWKIHSQTSPVSQSEWSDHWPDPTTQTAIQQIEYLRDHSTPLGQFALIRKLTASTQEHQPPQASDSFKQSSNAIAIGVVHHHGQCKISAHPFNPNQVSKREFLVALPESHYVAPLAHYLESEIIRTWLDHHAEKRSHAWVLNEQTLKFLPIPSVLYSQLKEPSQPSHPNLRALLADIPYHPKKVLDSLTELLKSLSSLESPEEIDQLKTQFFIRAATAHQDLELEQNRLLSLVDDSGKIQWKEFLQILPSAECIAFTRHPDLKFNGSLPPHLPIHHISRMKAPQNSIFFSTESGLSIKASSDNRQLLDILAAQIINIKFPTWGELAQSIYLPKDIELAQATATDVLRCHQEQITKRNLLVELINACQPTRHPSV